MARRSTPVPTPTPGRRGEDRPDDLVPRLEEMDRALERVRRGVEAHRRRGRGRPPPREGEEPEESRSLRERVSEFGREAGLVNFIVLPSILLLVGVAVTAFLGNIWFFLAFLFWAINGMIRVPDTPIGPYGYNPPRPALSNLKALLNFAAFACLVLAFVMSNIPSAGFIAIIVGFIAYFRLGG